MAASRDVQGDTTDLFATSPQMRRRRRRGVIVKFGLLAALMLAIAALVTLILTVLNSSFGLVAVENAKSPSQLVASLGYPQDTDLGELTKQELVSCWDRRSPPTSGAGSSASSASSTTAWCSRTSTSSTIYACRTSHLPHAGYLPGVVPMSRSWWSSGLWSPRSSAPGHSSTRPSTGTGLKRWQPRNIRMQS